MERVNLVNNNGGVLRLPPGFRFQPTDEELVIQYLRRKILSIPLPAAIIPDADVCKSDPWDLPGDSEEERYFFSIKEVKYPNGNRSNRATVSGYWKATGLDKPVVASRIHRIVGMKKTLVFYQGKAPRGARTNWVMHEYRLNTPNNLPQDKNWVICRIFLKKRGNGRDEDDAGEVVVPPPPAAPVFYDFLAKERGRRAPANSGSSEITEEFIKAEENEEDSSSGNSVAINYRKK